MSKIELNNVSSGYNLAEINVNFQKIEDALNNLVLYRNPPDGEPNTMEKPLDVNGQAIINVGDLEVNGDSVQDLVAAAGASASAALVSEGNAATSESNAAASETNAAASAAFIEDWEYKGTWATSTVYDLNNIVTYLGSSYICTTAHTSTGSFNADNWDIFAQQGAAGAGTGDMLGANNLSEVTNTSLARLNIGLGNVNNTSDANKPVSTATQTALDTKQDTLVSSTNIKTIDGNSLLGSGNLSVATAFSSSAENISGTVENKAVDPLGIREAFNASGSAPVFACRAFVNFNGTRNVTDTGASTNGQPVLLRASGNVTSVVKNSTGDYTINFTAPMPDANYSVVGMVNRSNGLYNWLTLQEEPATARSTSAVRVQANQSGAAVDPALINVAIFR